MPWKERRPGGWLIVDDVTTTGARKYDFARTSIDADKKVSRLRSIKAARRHLTPGSSVTIDDLLERWRQYKVAERRMSVGTMALYIKRIGALAKARHWKTASAITRDELRRWALDANNIGVSVTRDYLLSVLRVAVAEWDIAVDPGVLRGKWGSSKRVNLDEAPLLTDAEAAAIKGKADTHGTHKGLIVHWMERYGPRPATLAKMLVGHVSLERAEAWLGHVKNGMPLMHPLFPDTLARLRVVIGDRGPKGCLFLTEHGEPYSVRAEDGAAGLTRWYRMNVDARGIYQLKRRAITRMFQGAPPWRAPMTLADVKLFTGHTSDEPLRYQRTNQERARWLSGSEWEIKATKNNLDVLGISITPDFTVKYH